MFARRIRDRSLTRVKTGQGQGDIGCRFAVQPHPEAGIVSGLRTVFVDCTDAVTGGFVIDVDHNNILWIQVSVLRVSRGVVRTEPNRVGLVSVADIVINPGYRHRLQRIPARIIEFDGGAIRNTFGGITAGHCDGDIVRRFTAKADGEGRSIQQFGSAVTDRTDVEPSAVIIEVDQFHIRRIFRVIA